MSDKLHLNMEVIFSTEARSPQGILMNAVKKIYCLKENDWSISKHPDDLKILILNAELDHISDVDKLHDLLIDKANHDLVLQLNIGIGFVALNDRVNKDYTNVVGSSND